jgi:hypothetical protein
MKEFTKLRYIKSKDAAMISAALMRLRFKVEIKSIYFDGKNHYCWFTIRDTDDMDNVEL